MLMLGTILKSQWMYFNRLTLISVYVKKRKKVFKSASLMWFPYKFSTSCSYPSFRINFDVNLLSSKAVFGCEYVFGGHKSSEAKWNIQLNIVVVIDLVWWFYIITIYFNHRIICVSITTFAFTFPKLKIEICRNVWIGLILMPYVM